MHNLHFFSIIVAAAFLILEATTSFAQSEMQDFSCETPLSEGQFKPLAPDVWSIAKYGDKANAALYTGAASISIPIYTYKDMDFTIPVSLEYNCDGFKPSSECGVVGYGWSLNVGGVITREVRGVPDEVRDRSYSMKAEGDCSANAVYAVASAAQVSAGLLKNMLYQYNRTRSVLIDGYARRYASSMSLDSIDYCYSGEMGKEYMLCRKISNSMNNYVEMEPDIYHYNFLGYSGSFILGENGDVKVMNSNSPAGEIAIAYSYSDSVPLLCSFAITTGDGTKYYFDCRDLVDSYSSQTSDLGEHSISSWKLTSIESPSGRTVTFGYAPLNEAFTSSSVIMSASVDHLTLTDSDGNVTRTWESNTDLARSTDELHNVVSSPALRSISLSGCVNVQFSYSSEYGRHYLDSLKVTNMNGTVIKSCHLDYLAKSPSVATLLKDVEVSGDGVYRMTYYDEGSTFPSINAGMDDWYGYYSTCGNQPTYSGGSLDVYATTLVNARSVFNFGRTRMGMLERITYPTGGYSEYTYEQNDYSYDGRDGLISNRTTGGLRVKRIDNYAEAGTLVQSRRFSYVGDNGLSSGVLLSKPHVRFHYRMESPTLKIERDAVCSASDMGFSTDGHLEYLRVLEEVGRTIDGSPESATESRFLSNLSSPDEEQYESAAGGPSIYDGWNFTCQDLGSDYVEAQMHRNSLLKGMPASTMVYSGSAGDGNILYGKATSYSTYGTTDAQSVSIPSTFHCGYYNRVCSLLSVYSSGSTETMYGSDHSLMTTSSTSVDSLNAKGRPVLYSTSDSKGRSVTTALSFLPQVPSFLTGKTVRVDGSVSESEQYGYTQYSINGRNIFLPSSVRRGVISSDGTISGYDQVLTVDGYDGYGNVTGTHDILGNSIGYQWGYNGLFLTSKSIVLSEGRSLVTSWTYEPLLGMTSMTAPNGVVTRYSLDAYGRLTGVSEGGDIIGKYQYNIVNFKR
jgi:hypothetical protein